MLIVMTYLVSRMHRHSMSTLLACCIRVDCVGSRFRFKVKLLTVLAVQGSGVN